MIGKRLRLARSAAGFSLRELQGSIGNLVTAQAIGKYERDESMPGSRVLMALAEALGVPEDYLLSQQATALERVEFSQDRLLSRREKAQIEAKVLHLAERYLAIEELLGLETNWDEPRNAPFPVTRGICEADSAAMCLRDHWGLGQGPILNMAELLEERGVKILAVDIGNTAGFTVRIMRPAQRSIPVFVINQKDWAERKRFNLAHELGRLIMQVNPKLDPEKADRRFSRAFLMPAESMWTAVGKHRTSIELAELLCLKQRFGASCQAVAARCRDLNITGESLNRELLRQFKRMGWRSPPYKEHGSLPPASEDSTRFMRLCYRAVSEGAVSEPKAAECLGIPARELGRRMSDREAYR